MLRKADSTSPPEDDDGPGGQLVGGHTGAQNPGGMGMDTSHNHTATIGRIPVSEEELAEAGKAFIKSLNIPEGPHNIEIDIRMKAEVNKGVAYEQSMWQKAKPEQLLLLAVAMSGAVGEVLANIAALGYEEYVSRVDEIESRAARLSGKKGEATLAAAEAAEAKPPSERTAEDAELLMCLKAHRQQGRIDSVIEALRRSTKTIKSGRTDIPTIAVQMIR